MSVRILQRWAPRVHLRADAGLALPGENFRTAARSDRSAGRSAGAFGGRDRVDHAGRSVVDHSRAR